MIMGETLVLTILSGIVGSVFGILISEIGVMLLDAGDFSLGYDPQTFILAFGITIFVGLIVEFIQHIKHPNLLLQKH